MAEKPTLLSHNESIARKDLALREFAQRITHDTNNYYGVIQGYVSLLELQMKDHEQVAKYLEPIKSALDSGIQLNKQISLLYRQSDIMVVRANLADLVKSAAAEFAAKNDFTVTVRGESPEVILDAPSVTKLIADLCMLAKTLGDPKATFTLAGVTLSENDTAAMILDSSAGDFAQIVFEINSGKLEPDDETRYFNPFVISAEKSKVIGLGCIYGLLRNHHGNIDVTVHRQSMLIKIYFPA